ncbi:MAG: hypothetical protein V7629_11205 [Motiliproteus sp.]
MFSMSRPRNPERQHEPHNQRLRKRLLIDKRLQGRLLVALVLLETSMLVAAMFYLYQRFSTIVDANLFTIHRSAQVSLLPEFLQQMGWVVLVMSIVNTLALLAAHALWTGRFNQVLQSFRKQLQRIATLDLRPLEQAEKTAHEVLEGLELWRAQEQVRLQQVRLQVDSIVAQVAPGERQVQLRPQLLSLRRLLKPTHPAPPRRLSDLADRSEGKTIWGRFFDLSRR